MYMDNINNPYYQFLTKILKDYRLTIGSFAVQFGFPSFAPIMHKLKTEPNKKVHPRTLRKVEEALHIRIIDTDINHLRYERLALNADTNTIFLPTNVETWSVFQVHKNVRGSFPEVGPDSEIVGKEIFDYPQLPGVAAVKVPDNSMHPLISQGDVILVDPGEPLVDGCLVLAIKLNEDFAIRKYRHVMDDTIELYTVNPAVESKLFKRHSFKALYRAVMQNRRFVPSSISGTDYSTDF